MLKFVWEGPETGSAFPAVVFPPRHWKNLFFYDKLYHKIARVISNFLNFFETFFHPSSLIYGGGGEVTDFEAIYVEHFGNVCKYVFSLCRDESLAEEITQEAFYKAMQHIDRFDGKCKLYVWLCQIAKNTYYTYAKKQKRCVPEAEAGQSLQETQGFEHEVLDKETTWRLHKLLHRLEEPYKEVFTLRVFGELPFSRIGELFGKTDAWARLVFYRAKKELRRDLDENIM